MQYTSTCKSPIGNIFLAADEIGLTGLWFDGQKYFAHNLDPAHEEKDLPVFKSVRKWLDIYFAGQEPDFIPPVHLIGTLFQISIWKLLRQIPYGQTATYGELARKIAEEKGLAHMSAQAVGGAVGHNPISIIVPCHRVAGSDGSLTGYAGGVDKKKYLLSLEGVDVDNRMILL